VSHVSIPAGASIGHIHLKVSDLPRGIWFYRDVLGFDLLYDLGSAAFLSAGGYHHHIGLNTWESAGGTPPARGSTGMYHFAINYPTKRDLAVAYQRLGDNGWGIDGHSDHGTHLAIYLHDPDHNGIELAWDRDQSEWPVFQGMSMQDMRAINGPLDFDALMAELDKPAESEPLGAGT